MARQRVLTPGVVDRQKVERSRQQVVDIVLFYPDLKIGEKIG
jgi:hypothetical protein